MKETFIIFDKFVNNSGFEVDERGAVTGPPEALNADSASNPKAIQFADDTIRKEWRAHSRNGVVHRQIGLLLGCSRSRRSVPPMDPSLLLFRQLRSRYC
jgi:hypothetical protein